MTGGKTLERVRRTGNTMSLRWRLVLLVSTEIIFYIAVAFGLVTLLRRWVELDTGLLLLLVLVSVGVLVGLGVTSLLSKRFFAPVFRLRDAMDEVSKGNFDVRLEAESSSREIREVFERFNQMTHELKSTEILQTDFVSNVSHEFKTPINAIEGYSTLLQDCETLDAEGQEYVEKILLNTDRLSSLVGNVLLLSKLENQTIGGARRAYRLDEQIRQALLLLEPRWQEKNVTFDVELESVTYEANEGLMLHVWTNLISNAVKFTPADSVVTLRLTKEAEGLRFTVSDRGPGLSEEAQKHLFDKFYQGDTSHRQEGNGLGLPLVRRILDTRGGRIRGENVPGGCRFTVLLPL